jgi:hypothetical protein
VPDISLSAVLRWWAPKTWLRRPVSASGVAAAGAPPDGAGAVVVDEVIGAGLERSLVERAGKNI